MAVPTSQTNKLPIIPSEQGILKDDYKSLISLPWIQWFIALSAKINTININSVGWSGVPFISGVTAGTYGDATHYPTFTVSVNGLITLAGQTAFTSGGGNATYVTNQTGSYSVLATDVPAASSYKGLINISSSTTGVLTLSADASLTLPIGAECGLFQGGVGAASFAGGTGTTLVGPTISGAGKFAQGKATKIAVNTWLISGNLSFVAAGGDPYYTDVSALLHFDGTPGATTFTDEKGTTWTTHGGSVLSSTKYAFGGSSYYASGHSNNYASASGSQFNLGTGDFTIEGWFTPTDSSVGGIFSSTSGVDGIALVYNGGGAPSQSLQLYNGSTQVNSASSIIVVNTSYFFSVVRSGSSLVVYLDGVAVISTTTSINITTSTFNIGEAYGTSYCLQGYIDEFRITKGIARYITTYSNQTVEFPNF